MCFVKVNGCKMNIQPPPSSFRMDKRNTFLEKKRRGGVRGSVETETTMSAGEGPSSGRLCAPGIEENRNAKQCRNRCRMDLPGPTTSVGTRTDYSVGPWDYLACATRHLKAWSTRTAEEKYSVRKLYMSRTVWKTPRRTRLVLSPYSDL
jgi:hypothetical protein